MTITKAECDRLAKTLDHPGWDITAYVVIQTPHPSRWQRIKNWIAG